MRATPRATGAAPREIGGNINREFLLDGKGALCYNVKLRHGVFAPCGENVVLTE